jgi:hypothetical protein
VALLVLFTDLTQQSSRRHFEFGRLTNRAPQVNICRIKGRRLVLGLAVLWGVMLLLSLGSTVAMLVSLIKEFGSGHGEWGPADYLLLARYGWIQKRRVAGIWLTPHLSQMLQS